MVKLMIDDEFKNLIPPLTDEEFQQLEQNILSDGIREPLVIWNGTLIDGHNRYAIAQKHNLPFQTTEKIFDSRAAAVEWIIQNQFGRRNISTFDRICLALKLKPTISEKAKENQGKRTDILPATFDQKKSKVESVDTLKQIANLAGVGKETVRKVEKILELAQAVNLEDIISGLRKGDISISLAYEAANFRKQDLDAHAQKVKEELQKFKENYQLAKNEYAEFCKQFEQMTQEEQQHYLQTKNEIEKLLKNFEEFF